MICPNCNEPMAEWRDDTPPLNQYVLVKAPSGYKTVMVRRKIGKGEGAEHWFLGQRIASNHLLPLKWMSIPE